MMVWKNFLSTLFFTLRLYKNQKKKEIENVKVGWVKSYRQAFVSFVSSTS